MKMLKNAVFVLAIGQMLIALLIAAVGSFADGGTIWDWTGMAIIQPIAALLLLAAVWPRRSASSLLSQLAVVMLAANITANTGFAVSIVSGATRGDWFMPLAFVVIPVIGLLYLVLANSRRRTAVPTMKEREIFALAIGQMIIALVIAAIGNFADGGTIWDWTGMAIIQPIAALLLLAAVWPRRSTSPLLSQLAVVMLAANVTVNTGFAVAIVSGAAQGDWFVPLAFVIIPVIGLIYLVMANSRPPAAAPPMQEQAA